MGYYFRSQHELLLIGMRGTVPTPPSVERVGSVHRERATAHSVKPAWFAAQLERMYPEFFAAGLFVELFCRSPRPGWDAWGNQIGAAIARFDGKVAA
jgi:N6-adenosine-specific RNA methylase IME4